MAFVQVGYIETGSDDYLDTYGWDMEGVKAGSFG